MAADTTDIVGEVLAHISMEGAVEGAGWVAEGVVKFVVVCFEGLIDGI